MKIRKLSSVSWAALLVMAAACRTQPAPAPNSPRDIATEYDLVYAISHGRVSLQPSPFLLQQLAHGPKTGTALDIGSGNGRNALYLAAHGFRVTAVDLSHIGLDLTRQKAEIDHLPVTTVAADINQFPIGQAKWDLITLIDFPFAYKPLLPRILAGLKPGGMVVIHDVSDQQTGLASPDKMLHYTFMNRRAVEHAFAGFHILHDSEGLQPTVWGVKAIMISFAAIKPAG